MNRKAVSGIMQTLLLMGMLTLAFNIQLVESHAGTITVPDDYPTIQEAVNAANDRDTIFVRNGTYYENVIVNKTVSLVGQNAGMTIIDGNETGTVIYVSANNVLIVNFTIRNSGEQLLDSGVHAYKCANITLKNSNITNNGVGIQFYISSDNSVVENEVTNNRHGILLVFSGNNWLRNNVMFANRFNFGMLNYWLSDFINDVDASNTVNGKPIYYLVNKRDEKISPDAGCVVLVNCTNMTLENLNLTNNYEGVLLAYTNGSLIQNVTATNNWFGVLAYECSSNNRLAGNDNITNNEYGVWLAYSSNNILRDNDIANNTYNFGVEGESPPDFLQDIDTSNTVNNKPIIYWVNRTNDRVPKDAGYVALINSRNVTVQDLNLTHNGQGILLAYTNNTKITKNNLTNNGCGVDLLHSFNNTLAGNNVASNWAEGVGVRDSSNNTLAANNIANNFYGIWFYYSSYNKIIKNSIVLNNYGVGLQHSSYNRIYHNNFKNNDYQVCIIFGYCMNVWDDGYPSGGNYWSDYNGTDLCSGAYQNETGSDGIGDTPYFINGTNQDRYPLMNPWKPEYTLTIYSSPTRVTFTVNDVSHTTPWSGTYDHGTSVSLVMSEIHTVGEAKYYWNKWSDEVTSRSRTVIVNRDITLTGLYTGPYYELTVTSSPITGITFTINGTPEATPYTEWLPEGSYTLIMPETHNGYVWSHWLEDRDTSRTKTITLSGTTWTGVYVPAPPPPAVGGDIVLVKVNKPPRGGFSNPLGFAIACTVIVSVISAAYVKHRKKKQT